MSAYVWVSMCELINNILLVRIRNRNPWYVIYCGGSEEEEEGAAKKETHAHTHTHTRTKNAHTKAHWHTHTFKRREWVRERERGVWV